MSADTNDADSYPTGRASGFEMHMFVSYDDCGDAYVVAPDGRVAGLIWETSDTESFETVIGPEKGRWGTYAVSLPLPLTTDAEADAYLAALLPRLFPRGATTQKLGLRGGRDVADNNEPLTGPLADDPFDYLITKSGDVRIFRGGRSVTVVRGSAAARLSARLGQGDMQDQHLLARVTGNYKQGNERR